MKLKGKVALITGASRGIGRATARLFALEGASVIINYTNRVDAAKEIVAEIRDNGGTAIAIKADVSDRSQVERMVSESTERFRRVDILVNNAGILLHGSVMTMNEEELDQMIGVNIKGIVNCVQLVAPRMVEQGHGKVINISSLAALGTAVGGTTPYGLTKAAVISLTKRMAFELGPKGIHVNAICPGFIQTDMLASISGSAEELSEALATPAAKAILGRVGQPQDIASSALFLSSEDSNFITAQVLTVDGGRMDFLTHSA